MQPQDASVTASPVRSMRYVFVVLFFSALLLIFALFFKMGQDEAYNSPAVQEMFQKLGLATDPKVAKMEQDFREEQLNKLRMLKKRFDGLESSVAKIDVLEKTVDRIDSTVEGLVKIVNDLTHDTAGLKGDERMIVEQPASTADTPLEKKCQFTEVEGLWTPEWKWINQGCSTELEQGEADSCLSTIDKIAFLGDSQIYHLSRTFIRSLSSMQCTEIRSGGRCGQVADYLGLVPIDSNNRVDPDQQQLEGPRIYGKEHPGCTDCAGCDFGLMNCTANAVHPLYVEYLPVEFARDVEQQSVEARTTQENMALYLARSPIHSSWVIFNVGLHDSMVLDTHHDGSDTMDPATFEKTATLYKHNLKWFASVLQKSLPSTQFIFVTTTPKNLKFFTDKNTNVLIKRMNDDAREVMKELGMKTVDVFPLLDSDQGRELLSDEVHAHAQGGAYYKALKDILVRRVCDLDH